MAQKPLVGLSTDEKRWPVAKWQTVNVTFATSETDVVVPHALAPIDPLMVKWEVVDTNVPGVVYRGIKSPTSNYTVLRASVPGSYQIRLYIPAHYISNPIEVTNVFGISTKNTAPSINLWETDNGVDAGRWRFIAEGGLLYLQALNDAQTVSYGGWITDRVGNFVISGGLFERSRSTAMGDWITVPYNAADFAADTGTWTVSAPDFAYSRYTMSGHTMLWRGSVVATSLSVGSSFPRWKIPGGFTNAIGSIAFGYARVVNNGVVSIGAILAPASANYLEFRDTVAGGGFSNVADATYIEFVAIVEVN